MFGSIGGFEILVLLAIGLLVFGPRRLPEVGRWVARGLGELKKAAADVKSAMEQEADLGDVTRAASDIKKAVNTEARKLFTGLEEEVSLAPRGAAKGAPGEPPPAAPAPEAPAGGPTAGEAGREPGSAAAGAPGEPAPEAPGKPSPPAGSEEGVTGSPEERGPSPPEGTRHR